MLYETLLLEAAGGVATVTLNRPKVLHALNALTFSELEHAFLALAADSTVRVILLTGSGEKAFAAGADIREIQQAIQDESVDAAEQGEALARRGQAVFRLIETCGKPVLALINGFALGGGCELALACTLRLAAETARLGLPEIKLGLIPGYGGTQRLPRLIGRPAALRLILSGDMIAPPEALRLGLVDEVHPAADLLPRGQALARAIAAAAPLAVHAALEAVRRGAALTLEDATIIEAEIFGRLCATHDVAEGTTAFLEKRQPAWQGR